MSEQPPDDGAEPQQPAESQPPGDDELAFPDLKPGDAWGESITKRRADELEARLQVWEREKENGERKGPFDDVRLVGADVFWLAAVVLAGRRNEQAVLAQAGTLINRDGHLQDYSDLHLEGADLIAAHLEGAYLNGAHLESAFLIAAHLEGAMLHSANLFGAMLERAHLESAELSDSGLEEAYLHDAHLEDADLTGAHLEGAVLDGAHLNEVTALADAVVSDQTGWLLSILRIIMRRRIHGAISLADVRWNGADLTAVDWSRLRRLGDERGILWQWTRDYEAVNWSRLRDLGGERGKIRWWKKGYEQERATRANIQLAKQLDNAGLKDDSDRFAYRAHVCQRGVHLRRFRLGRWLFSWLLFILAGYGYRPLRTLFWYLAVIGAFAFAFFQATHGALAFGLSPSEIQPLPWYEALVLSVSSFHGRGFFQPVQSLGDPVAILAAIEAVFGLFIEVSFIATFTQRYFGK